MHGEPATLSANAAECAADQNAFWPYHDRLFAQISAQGAAAVTVENMRTLATEFNLDENAFGACLTQQTHNQDIQASVNEAIALGLPGTPSILVDGQRVDSLDYAVLADAVNAALAAAGSN